MSINELTYVSSDTQNVSAVLGKKVYKNVVQTIDEQLEEMEEPV